MKENKNLREKIAESLKKNSIEIEEASEKRGLWANIHAKRKRGEAPAKKGDKDYPDKKAWEKAKKSSKD